MVNFTFKPFERKDYALYKEWHEDTQLAKHLGPLDEDWLEYILNETDGSQYAVFLEDEMIAVIGMKYGDVNHPFYVLTEFAIKPTERSKGHGTSILDTLINRAHLQSFKEWKTFVDVKNERAKAFFLKNGWNCSEAPDAHGMWELNWNN